MLYNVWPSQYHLFIQHIQTISTYSFWSSNWLVPILRVLLSSSLFFLSFSLTPHIHLIIHISVRFTALKQDNKGAGNVDLYSADTWNISKALRYSRHRQGISQFYLHTVHFIRKGNEPYLPLPSQPQVVLICRPPGDGRLSRPWCKVAPTEMRTCNLQITSATLYHAATGALDWNTAICLLLWDGLPAGRL